MVKINVNLPQKKDEILIDFIFSYGYSNESTSEFGLAHLAEHYLVTVLEQKYKPLYIDGTTDDFETTFSFGFKKSNFKKNKQSPETILEDIKNFSQKIDTKILNNEKKRIQIELEEKYSHIFSEIIYGIESKIIDKPKTMRRSRLDQLKNVNKFKDKDIKKVINKILKSKTIVFVGYNGNKNDYNKRYKISSFKDINQIELTKKSKLQFISKNSILKKSKNFAIAFPIKKTKDTDSYYINFITKEVYKKLDDNVRDFGVYKSEYLYRIRDSKGYVWYFLNSYSSFDKDISKVFLKSVDEVLKDKDLNKKLDDFKKDMAKKSKPEWSSFYERFDWIIYDFFDDGKVTELSKAIKDLNNLNITELKKFSKKIFSSSKKIVLE